MLILLAACVTCPEGQVADQNGFCVADGTSTGEGGDGLVEWEELYASWPTCEPLTAGTSLDLVTGCASDVCVGMTLAEATEILGTPSCEGDTCEWTNGIAADFDGTPQDGTLIEQLVVDDPYQGADGDGLGLGAGLRCFAEVFGPPTAVDFWGADGTYAPWGVFWAEAGLHVFDIDAITGDRDWRVDTIYFEGF